MTKIHGGFKEGDNVEYKDPVKGNWHSMYVIVDFELMRVKIYNKSFENVKKHPNMTWWVPIGSIRHPQLARKIIG